MTLVWATETPPGAGRWRARWEKASTTPTGTCCTGTLARARVPALWASWASRSWCGRAFSVNRVSTGSPGPPGPKPRLVGSGRPMPTPMMPWLEGPSARADAKPEAPSSVASTASRRASRSSETPASAKTDCSSASWPSASRPELLASGFSRLEALGAGEPPVGPDPPPLPAPGLSMPEPARVLSLMMIPLCRIVRHGNEALVGGLHQAQFK